MRSIGKGSRYARRHGDHAVYLTREKDPRRATIHVDERLCRIIGVAPGDRLDLFVDPGVVPDAVAIGKPSSPWGGYKTRQAYGGYCAFSFTLPAGRMDQLFPDGEQAYAPPRADAEDGLFLWFDLPPGKSAARLEGPDLPCTEPGAWPSPHEELPGPLPPVPEDDPAAAPSDPGPAPSEGHPTPGEEAR